MLGEEFLSQRAFRSWLPCPKASDWVGESETKGSVYLGDCVTPALEEHSSRPQLLLGDVLASDSAFWSFPHTEGKANGA